MPEKRDQSLTVKLSDVELAKVKQTARECSMDVSEMLRACICLGSPILKQVAYVRRVRLEDNSQCNEISNTLGIREFV